jgi:MerR family mercuric resistance operon transcriptional regulator
MGSSPKFKRRMQFKLRTIVQSQAIILNNQERNLDMMTIGKVARQAGVNVETIRYYQKIGLIQEPEKPAFGYRHYPIETISRIHFIKRAKNLGFTLQEIGVLLKLGDGNCLKTREIARKKLLIIESRIQDLQAISEVLKDLINSCESQNTSKTCPIISALK